MDTRKLIYLFIIIVLAVAFLLPSRQLVDPVIQELEVVTFSSDNSEPTNQPPPSLSLARVTVINTPDSVQTTVQPGYGSESDIILAGLESFEPTFDQLDALIESAQSRYAILISNLNLNVEDEQTLINLIADVLKKELYLGQLVEEGTISQEAFRRLSTTTEDLTFALSGFLTEEEMLIYTEFQDGQEQRFLNRWENIMYDQVTALVPELNELERSIIAAIFVEELSRLRSGEVGVLSNEHLRTAYIRTREWLKREWQENESAPDALEQERIQEFLNTQIMNISP